MSFGNVADPKDTKSDRPYMFTLFFFPTNYVKITILIIIIQFEHGMREMELNNYCTNLINSGPVIDPWGTP